MALDSVSRSPAVRVVVIGALILFLQIPVLFTYGLMSERESSKNSAVREIAQSWGLAQEVVGPYLVVPYRTAHVRTNEAGQAYTHWVEDTATFLPDALEVSAVLDGQTLHRGIYESVVYAAEIGIVGSFSKPDFSKWNITEEQILWDQARLMLEVSDARGFRDSVEVTWAGEAHSFEPGERTLPGARQGLQTALNAADLEAETFPFEMNFDLKGRSNIRFAPLGRRTETRITGAWPSPSFQGAWLPDERETTADGFSASWAIPFLGRSFPQSWTGALQNTPLISQFGVDLLTPVDAYRQTERSLKYELLFLALTFAPLWLFEVLAGIRLHFIQYGLIGAAICLFYLLELSLAEQLGFANAYALAAAMIAGLVTSYAWSVLGSVSRAATMGAVISGLYGFLYVLISLEDFALLVGSLALFAVLAVLMYTTRRVNWFQVGSSGKPADPA
ncbi:MAG: cell envelope integrity protein CreD [Acidobacteria bacterium]|nr:cell envelope integrity protein CreD [Acidobacteriota bacterium]